MSDYHNKRAAEIIKQIIYITIATADRNGKPWNSPVARFYDNDLNFYWFSDKESVHSRNIRENSDVFLIIYDSTMPEGTGEAVYIEAKAHEITDTAELERVVGLQNGNMKISLNQVTGNAIHRFYVAKPKKLWMNDDQKDQDGNYIKDIRIELSLVDLKKELARF